MSVATQNYTTRTVCIAQGIRMHIRWMEQRDMREVLQIENESFEFPWTEEDFLRCRKQRNCICMVAEIVNVARHVCPDCQGKKEILVYNNRPRYFRRCRHCDADGMTDKGPIVGFMIYELHTTRLHILNFAVSRQFRCHGVGGAMVAKLVDKLSHQRRNRIMLEVRETNLAAQLFFKAKSFRTVSVLRDFFDDTTEDAYLMQYRYGVGDQRSSPR